MVTFYGFNTREEWVSFAQKLYAEKKLAKLTHFEQVGKNNKKWRKQFENFGDWINRCFDELDKLDKNDYDTEDTISNTLFVFSNFLSIDTNSRGILKLLNDFIKRNHYENNYCIHGLDITIDELLE